MIFVNWGYDQIAAIKSSKTCPIYFSNKQFLKMTIWENFRWPYLQNEAEFWKMIWTTFNAIRMTTNVCSLERKYGSIREKSRKLRKHRSWPNSMTLTFDLLNLHKKTCFYIVFNLIDLFLSQKNDLKICDFWPLAAILKVKMTFDFDSGHRFGILASRCIRMHGQILKKRNLKIWQKSKISTADISKTVENFSSATSASHISMLKSIHLQNFRKKSQCISEKSQKIDFWPRFWPWPRFRKWCPDPPSLVHMLLIDIWVEFLLLLVMKKIEEEEKINN